MSPYQLEKALAEAKAEYEMDNRKHAIFSLLCALIQHEADKEAELNIERRKSFVAVGQ